MRTWSATIEVRESRSIHEIAASTSEYDLVRDQSEVAAGEAALFLTDTNEVHVTVFKTTKARGTERDRSFHVFRDRRGQVRYQ